MTIRDEKQFLAGVWEWTELDECFRRNIRVSDIDGIVESHGRFLVIEAKKPGVELTIGQRRMLDEMRDLGNHTVIVVWGHGGLGKKPRVYEVMLGDKDRWYDRREADLSTLQRLVERWFRWTNGNGAPPTAEEHCIHGVIPEDCYLCSGAAKILREAGLYPAADWKAQIKELTRISSEAGAA